MTEEELAEIEADVERFFPAVAKIAALRLIAEVRRLRALLAEPNICLSPLACKEWLDPADAYPPEEPDTVTSSDAPTGVIVRDGEVTG